MTMCNAWLSFDIQTSKSFASTSTFIETEIGTAVLFNDGSAGYLTPGTNWRQLLTHARRDALLAHLAEYYEFLSRNQLTRLLYRQRRADMAQSMTLLKGVFDVGTE